MKSEISIAITWVLKTTGLICWIALAIIFYRVGYIGQDLMIRQPALFGHADTR